MADERIEAWEQDDQRELDLLYNHRADDSLQFNRGQMRAAIRHGKRIAATRPAPKADSALVGELERTLTDFMASREFGEGEPEDNPYWRDGYLAALDNLREELKPWKPLGRPLSLAALSDRDVVLEEAAKDWAILRRITNAAIKGGNNPADLRDAFNRIDAALKGGVDE